MKVETQNINEIKIAEIISFENIINNNSDGLDLPWNLYYQDFNKPIIYKQNISPDFFELKNGMEGEIFQKFQTIAFGWQ